MSIPALIYAIQNNIIFYAVGLLPMSVYQVAYQMKILTTAGFSSFLLKRPIPMYQQVSLVLLTIGVAIVSLSQASTKTTEATDGITFDINSLENLSKGLLAVAFACVTSGFAGILCEKLYKDNRSSLWVRYVVKPSLSAYSSQEHTLHSSDSFPSVFFSRLLFSPYLSPSQVRNCQLGVFSVLCTSIFCLVADHENIFTLGFFAGWQPLTYTLPFLHAVGGMSVAFIVKYMDNIAKGFATSFSMVIGAVCSWYYFETPVSLSFTFGAVLVIVATLLYSKPNQSSPASAASQPIAKEKIM